MWLTAVMGCKLLVEENRLCWLLHYVCWRVT
jgi:hypothetical protein